MARDRCVDELQFGSPLADQHARIAALEAQNAALAGVLREAVDTEGPCDDREHDDCWVQRALIVLTADAQHLAQLDAARREVCAAAERWRRAKFPYPGGAITLSLDDGDFVAAIDALAKLEGQHG